jgi:hypothetical protein
MEQYPKPQTPYTGHSDLYFATEWQVRSWAVLAGYDRGELTVTPGRITFCGMDLFVDCTGVTAVGLVRKTFPWVTVLAVLAVATALIYTTSPTPFAWGKSPILFVVCIIIVASIIQSRERWVEVIYMEGDRERRAYFRRTGKFMWWRGGARTRQLYHELRLAVTPDTASKDTETSDGAKSR